MGTSAALERPGFCFPHATIPTHTLWHAGIQRWAIPTSLAATEGILVSFFSSA